MAQSLHLCTAGSAMSGIDTYHDFFSVLRSFIKHCRTGIDLRVIRVSPGGIKSDLAAILINHRGRCRFGFFRFCCIIHGWDFFRSRFCVRLFEFFLGFRLPLGRGFFLSSFCIRLLRHWFFLRSLYIFHFRHLHLLRPAAAYSQHQYARQQAHHHFLFHHLSPAFR